MYNTDRNLAYPLKVPRWSPYTSKIITLKCMKQITKERKQTSSQRYNTEGAAKEYRDETDVFANSGSPPKCWYF